MIEKRIQFSNIVYNQLPAYVREEFPLVAEFLSEYYRSQEFQGAPIDLIQNIDKYIKVDEVSHQIDSVVLSNDITIIDDILNINILESPTGTDGFPEKYGLLKIDNEIITYTGKTFNSFTGCIRGFSGIDSYKNPNNPDKLIFSKLESTNHLAGSIVINLSSLFLKEFLLKIKYQLTPGFESRTLNENLNESLFIKQSKDFYRSKGTDESFEILFRSLYGEDVSIIRPKEYLFRPSDAQYQITSDLVVESIEGNPENLINSTLIQDEYLDFTKAYAPITNVEKIISKNGKEYYKLSIDSDYNKDITFDGGLYGEFKVHPQTKVIGLYSPTLFVVTVSTNPGISPPDSVYAINGQIQQQLTLVKGNTYRFDVSDSSNDGHSFIFKTIYGSSISSSYYSISSNGISGQTGSFIDLTINLTAPDETITYKCLNHNGMGANIKITPNSIDNLTALDVDSTIGFPNSGELYVTYNDQTQGTIRYESKSINQFLGCSNIIGIIEDSTNIGISTYARTFDNTNKVRITSVIKDFNLIDDTYYFKKGYTSEIKTLGVNSEDVSSNNWFFNISTSYDIESISLIDISDFSYQITTKLNNIFKIGDSLKIIDNSGVEKNSTITDIVSEKSFNVRGQGQLLLSNTYTIKRNILKTNSSSFPNTSIFNANVQNVYKQGNKTIVASPSLPYYNNQPLNVSSKQIVFSGTFDSDVFKITSNIDHGFYTGDVVYYTPEKILAQSQDINGNIVETLTILSQLFNEGIYFVKRIDKNNIKLSLSKSDIYNSKFISVNSPIKVTLNKFEYYKFKSKTLKSQNLFREISPPINDGAEYSTEPGFTGILINGVEILNYKTRDTVYYGSLDEIEVTSSGIDYDIINPPVLSISDLVGLGANAYCAVRGSLNEIRIVDPGFDYAETPTIKITGGNGVGAKAYASMKLVDHKATFNSEGKYEQVSLVDNIIGFSTYHKFRNAEQIIYNTYGQTGVGGISTDSTYFVSVQSPTEVKLHNTLGDAVSGINTINLISHGIGNHDLRSFDKKSILGSINITNSGFGYENKKKTILSSVTGINTSINQVNILNHEFKSGEIVNYSTNGSVIGGLTNNKEYYLTKIDNDSFKLSEIGTGLIEKDFYYNTRQFINLTSVGLGTHIFNYPKISVEIIGNVGISSIGSNNFKAIIQPIFRGEIISIHLENNGLNYGSPEILNYNRQPLITLNSGSGAAVVPIVSDGKIVEVLIISPGSGYNSPPDLVISGSGFGTVLTPIIENGQLIKVNVIEFGTGYLPNTTSIDVISAGSLGTFDTKIQKWNVNLFQKNLSIISDDDGFLSEGINKNFDLEYCHLYAPRKLREVIYSLDSDGNILYGRKDLRKSQNKEVSSTNHSPIIGWAYDGNPIYGPYGYSTKQGGIISQMKSGYELKLKQNRPPVSVFPAGFFIEDYTHFEVSDETILDKNNGRFCVTPEYPNGAYVYFATINISDADSSGPFSGYKSPVFPYLIGDNFNSRPNQFNFKKASNQIDLDLNETSFSRNTNPYNLIEDGASYSYLETPNLLNQTASIKYATPGFIEKINIISGGSGYKIGDKLVFDNDDTNGFNASAEVERIFGRSINSISVATTSISNVEFYPSTSQGNFLVFSENPHNFTNKDLIVVSGLNTTSSLIEGSYRIGVTTNTIALTSGIGSTATTGIVTYFSVAGNLNYPNIRENDILGIGTEQIKVLNVDTKSSRIRVLRAVNGTVGSSHSVTDVLYENSRKLIINAGFRSNYDYKVNREIYFNPIDAVGLGTSSGIGIGVTLIFSNPGVGITQIFIPTRSIYIPNHQLNTGDKLIYSTNNGSAIGVSTNGISTSVSLSNQSIVYVAKISDDLIGISTFKVGLGTGGTFVGITSQTSGMGILHFTNVGTGENHSFKTTYNGLFGNILKNIVTVSTAQTHGLLNNDTVFIDVNPSISTTFTFKYNDYNKKLLVNPKDFISAGINTITNTITIIDHKFESGQKVIHTATIPAIGLENNKEYFIFVVDTNNIRLTNTYYDSININPEIVDITSASNGTLSSINPPIKVYRNSLIVFDLSDSSLSHTQQATPYPAFDLKIFKDSNFTENYINNFDNEVFKVQKTGIVGITSDAKIILTIDENTPQNLYYNLIPIFDGINLPDSKKLISEDSDVLSNNEIQVIKSEYNGVHNIIVGSSTSFTYNITKTPEKDLYTSDISSITYETNSLNSNGTISKIKITNKGQNYYSIPEISNIISRIGTGAILESSSTSIGKIKSTKINDIGFDFPSDLTMRPSAAIPQIIKIAPLSSLESIKISSFGKGYTSPPKLIVLDGKTNSIVPEVNLKFTLGDNQIKILKNTFGLNATTPTILPIQNSNGVEISDIQYNANTKDVTVVLSVGFSTVNSFPFAENDKVLIENISVEDGSTGRGYNSENYNYQLFTLTSVIENLGGLGGSVTYNLNEFLNDSEFPGVFDPNNSSGRIIAQKHFPIFDVVLKKNNYFTKEIVMSESTTGIVEDWDSKSNFVAVLSKKNFKVGEVIKGSSSKTQGVASSIEKFDGFFNTNATSRFIQGWKSDAGVLNNNIQRIQDNLYYQNFSYSIKSKVDFNTWNDAVSALNHTTGFVKFSDYQLESNLSDNTSNTLNIDIPLNLTQVDIISDIVSVINLNCVYGFDLVKENSLQINSQIFSDEILFSNRILTDYAESVGNRVLSIDNISSQFNTNSRPTRFSEVYRFNLANVRSQKYLTYVRDKTFTGERQFLIVTSLIDEIGNVYLNQYAKVKSTYDMGSFDITIDGSDGVLQFFPTKFNVNNFDVTTLSYNINDNLTSVGSTNFGGVVDIQSSSVEVFSGPTTIIGIANTYRAIKVLVSIAGNNNQYEFDELNIIHDGTNVEFLEYGQLTNHSQDVYSSSGLGTYYSYLSGSQLKVDFTPNVGIAATINTVQVAFASTIIVGVGTHDMKHARLEGRSTSIASTSTPTPVVISKYPDIYDTAYFIVQVSDNTNNIHQLSEVCLIDDDTNVYVTEYAVINTLSSLGTIGAERNSSIVDLTFTPLPNINVDVKVYLNALRCEDDDKDVIDFLNSEIQTNCGSYEGTDTDIKQSFNLTHKNNPIFEKHFIGSSSTVVNITSDIISIPNHFFVTGEKVRYINAGAGTSQAIGIATTTFVGVGVTNKLPDTVYIVKIDNNNIHLARSAEDALKFTPKILDITSVGIGTLPSSFVSTNQNAKVVIAIDNIIQSPIVSTAITTTLATNTFTTENILFLNQITSFFSSDLIKIGDEIMRIDGVGIGSTNAIRVSRSRLGTVLAGYSTGSLVTKVTGNYNIVNNVINFAEPPYGNIPLSGVTNSPDERDYVGISTGSSFQGRSFIRSGVVNSSNETYRKNYIFDDISEGFNGITKQFALKSSDADVNGITNENAIILINDIFQGPGLTHDYYLSESVGITTIVFTGTATSVSYDVNNASIPRGGIIVSVGSIEGLGYQPLISAGGTATVSIAGTISTISIGNSGSGYRSGVQIVNVGVALSSTSTPIIEFIGTASVTNGSIVSIAITNPGSGYTSTNPPYVIFDSPLPYTNIPLIYSSGSSGVGTEAKVNIIVGQDSSVIDFEITNIGYGYSEDQILTVPIGGAIGIPTTGVTSITIGGTGATSITVGGTGGIPVTVGGTGGTPVTAGGIPLIAGGTGGTPVTAGGTGGTPVTAGGLPVTAGGTGGTPVTAGGLPVTAGGIPLIAGGTGGTPVTAGAIGGILVIIGGTPGTVITEINFKEFQISIQKTFKDKFSGWSIGELQILDELDDKFDNKRSTFPLTLSGNLFSIRSSKGSNINVQDTLLIFINDILQEPGKGYVFPGGSIIRFTESPKIGDTSKILFYRGSGSIDVVDVNILETVKIGDELTIGYDPFLRQSPTLQEEERTVTTINSIDLVNTNPYFGPGNINDETLERPITWCRQTEDKIINGLVIGKDRILYEAGITPTSYLIQSVGVGNTILYVDNVRPFFNAINENDTSLAFQNKVTLIPQEPKVGASATAIVSISGTITSIQISDGGVGYMNIPSVTIQNSVGIGTTLPVNATASALISSGNVTSISVVNPGIGYTFTNPPIVFVEPPSFETETNDVTNYAGDSGIIVGFGTTTISGTNKIIFDFHIPLDSYLRNTSIVGSAVTISSISVGDYFLIYNSNVGSASTLITSRDISNNVIGIGTNFVNNVYQVDAINNIQSNIIGIGTTSVRRIFARISGISNITGYSGVGIGTTSTNFGNFSWGKIELATRTEENSYNFYGNNGVGGISTSGVVKRTLPLRFEKYIIT
jgi:hypothetical protein